MTVMTSSSAPPCCCAVQLRALLLLLVLLLLRRRSRLHAQLPLRPPLAGTASLASPSLVAEERREAAACTMTTQSCGRSESSVSPSRHRGLQWRRSYER
jgi:hypothetical protein